MLLILFGANLCAAPNSLARLDTAVQRDCRAAYQGFLHIMQLDCAAIYARLHKAPPENHRLPQKSRDLQFLELKRNYSRMVIGDISRQRLHHEEESQIVEIVGLVDGKQRMPRTISGQQWLH